MQGRGQQGPGGRGGRGRSGRAAGPGGNCVCPGCGYSTPHTRGVPCFEKKCPKCGQRLVREQTGV